MALVDEEGSISSVISEPLGSRQSEDTVSLEDIAWADSCLIKDPEYLDSDWNHLRDALLEILDDEPHSHASFTATNVYLLGGSDMEMLASNEKVETAQFLELSNDDLPTSEESESDNDDSPISMKISAGLSNIDLLGGSDIERLDSNNKVETAWFLELTNGDNLTSEESESNIDLLGGSDIERLDSNNKVETAWFLELTNGDNLTSEESESENDDSLIKMKIRAALSKVSKRNFVKTPLEDAIRSSNDYLRVIETNDAADTASAPAEEMEPSTADIFKIWDLGIPDEVEDIEQVFQFMPRSFDDMFLSKDGSLDDLIAAMADFSLSKT